MTSDIKILGQKEASRFLDGGRTAMGVEVRFTVGDDGPFTAFLADDKFTPDAMRAAIETKADNVRASRAHFTK